MVDFDGELVRITESVWSSMLGLELSPASGEAALERTLDMVTASVSISGTWEGTLFLSCSSELARSAAGAMFGAEQASADEVRDAMGELANMIGGNLKATLAGSCTLSLPSVVVGPHELAVPNAVTRGDRLFFSSGKLFRVAVLERASA